MGAKDTRTKLRDSDAKMQRKKPFDEPMDDFTKRRLVAILISVVVTILIYKHNYP
jgi:hypothetical protein